MRTWCPRNHTTYSFDFGKLNFQSLQSIACLLELIVHITDLSICCPHNAVLFTLNLLGKPVYVLELLAQQNVPGVQLQCLISCLSCRKQGTVQLLLEINGLLLQVVNLKRAKSTVKNSARNTFVHVMDEDLSLQTVNTDHIG